jgi:Fe2+ transport system protein FeoA
MIKSLTELSSGEKGIIVKIEGGRGLVKRLADLGFIPEQEVEVVRIAPHGPLAIKVRGTMYALGRGIAEKIYVNIV